MSVLCFTILLPLCFSSRSRHTRCLSDWSSDVCSSDLHPARSGPEPVGLLCSSGDARLRGIWRGVSDERPLLPQSHDPGGGGDGVGKPESLPALLAEEGQRHLLPEKPVPG